MHNNIRKIAVKRQSVVTVLQKLATLSRN